MGCGRLGPSAPCRPLSVLREGQRVLLASFEAFELGVCGLREPVPRLRGQRGGRGATPPPHRFLDRVFARVVCSHARAPALGSDPSQNLYRSILSDGVLVAQRLMTKRLPGSSIPRARLGITHVPSCLRYAASPVPVSTTGPGFLDDGGASSVLR